MTANDADAPYHAHIYYAPAQRPVALALRDRLRSAASGGPLADLRFVGELRDHKVGDEVKIATPKGERLFTINSVH